MKSARLALASWLFLACAATRPTASTPPEAGGGAPAATLVASAASATTDSLARARDVVASADRSESDHELDAGRKPAELLAFAGVAPGMRVVDLAAGRGYTTELLARVVGDTGTVYGQNSKFILGFAEKEWAERLTKPVMKRVTRVDSELDEPLPADVKELDLVTFVLFYHDTVWLETDRERMNRNVFAALKHGGAYVILDHSSRAGEGLSVVKTLHRIEQPLLKAEVEKAGFVLEAEADTWRDASDTRDWSASPKTAGEKRGHSDRFALRFKKP